VENKETESTRMNPRKITTAILAMLFASLGVADDFKTLPGSPDGYYEFFHYNTSFQHKTQAAESVVLTKESGNWQVSAYRFK
jgi:Protein of unknown function (DUF4019)